MIESAAEIKGFVLKKNSYPINNYNNMRKGVKGFCTILIFALFASTGVVHAQGNNNVAQDAAYTKMIHQRAAKIVSALGITDSSKFYRVTNIVANQYSALNDIYKERDTKSKAIKVQNADNKDAAKTQLAALEQEITPKIEKQHQEYLSALSKELTAEQVDKVKDGMTYNVKNVTYNAYMQMLPNLTTEQKTQIMAWLVEAREHAIDAESSEKKHAWFGKYKGRINNYLSKSGIDMKKAEDDWQQRIKANQSQKSNG